MEYFCCNYCESYSKNHKVQEVYDHWISSHIDRPFQFYVTMLLKCYYCNTIDFYKNLKLHHNRSHFENDFIVVKLYNHMECGLCSYVSNNNLLLINHFIENHEIISDLNPIVINNSQLCKLLTLKVFKYHECGYCQILFKSSFAFQLHHNMNHTNLKMILTYHANQTPPIKLICGYCNHSIESEMLFQHLIIHQYYFKCSKCPYNTTNLLDAVIHSKKTHNFDSINYRCTEFYDWLNCIYLQMKLLFSNGLTLTMQNLLNTRYDKSNELNYLINTILRFKEIEYDKLKINFSNKINSRSRFISNNTYCHQAIQQSSYYCND